MSFNNAGKPIPFNANPLESGYLELNITNSVVDLIALKKSRFAIVQIQEMEGVTDKSKAVRYLTNGDIPKEYKGFIAGINDKIIFEKEELKAGIKFVSAEGTISSRVVVQFYEH